MKNFLIAAAVAAVSACGVSAANVAFVKGNEVSAQENGALTYFQNANLGTVVDAATLNPSAYDCLWIHIDRKGLAKGWENLPEEFKNKVSALKEYVNNGGCLYLSGHATQIAYAIGRVDTDIDVFGSGDGGNGSDKWLVSAQIGSNNSTAAHPIYAGMQSLKNDYKDYDCFGLLWGGGPDILREDHNCLWNNLDGVAFETNNRAKVLGAWGDCCIDRNNAGIVEFYPQSKGKGTVIVNGLAACQWVVENGTNEYAANIEKLTKNTLDYLVSDDRAKPYDNIVLPEDIKFEEPKSTGKVAMLVNAALYNDLTNVEKSAVALFNRIFPEAPVLYTTDLADLENYDCIWINIEKEQYIDNYDAVGIDDNLFEAVWDYIANDGNVYLTKHACFMTERFFGLKPDICGFGTAVADGDWYMNITAHIDWSHHTIFHGIETVDNGYGKLIPMFGGGASLYDTNCMWNIAPDQHTSICESRNARILGTWGHASDAKHGVGLIEFMRHDATQSASGEISKATAENRKGVVIANGIAANHFASLNDTENKYQDNIDALNKNIVSYLSPAYADSNIGTGIDVLDSADAEAIFFNLQGVRVANPASGLFIKVQNGKSSKIVVK